MGKVSLTLTTTHSTIHDTMKPFVVTLLALAAASAEINVAPGGPSGPNNLMGTSSNIVGQSSASGGLPTSVFAESRNAGDSYGAPSAPIIDSYSSSSNAAWASDPAPQAYPYNFGGLSLSLLLDSTPTQRWAFPAKA